MAMHFSTHVYVRPTVIAERIIACYTVHGMIDRKETEVMMILGMTEKSIEVGRYAIF